MSVEPDIFDYLNEIWLDNIQQTVSEDVLNNYISTSVDSKKIIEWIKEGNTKKPLRVTFGDLVTEDMQIIPLHVKYLYLTANKIGRFTNIPLSLIELNIALNPLTKLGTLPITLERLNISSTLLRELPRLPPLLVELKLGNTDIEFLPQYIPNTLKLLIIAGSKISEIQEGILPDGLHELDCTGCELNSLPYMPRGLVVLKAAYNNIHQITNWSDNLVYVDLRANPFEGRVPQYVRDIVLD
jgi:hypothetical protein